MQPSPEQQVRRYLGFALSQTGKNQVKTSKNSSCPGQLVPRKTTLGECVSPLWVIPPAVYAGVSAPACKFNPKDLPRLPSAMSPSQHSGTTLRQSPIKLPCQPGNPPCSATRTNRKH